MDCSCEWLAEGMEEHFYGFTTGVVKDNWDSRHQGMIRVEYILGTAGRNVTAWIPVMVPYAFDGCGIYVLPEIGSEVVVVFHMGDRNCPMAIGCLWNEENMLPEDTAAEGNRIKRFRTKGGSEIVFYEEEGKEAIELRTPSHWIIRMEEEDQVMLFQDREGKNGVMIQKKEGTVKHFAKKKLVFEVGGKEMIVMDGNKGSVAVTGDEIKEEGTKSHTVKSQNIQINGNQTKVNGETKTEVSSKGSLMFQAANTQFK